MIEQQIAQIADSIRSELIETRRDFHMHPELSGEEQRTAGIVANRLRESGLEVSTGVGGHGVIGLLKGKKDGPVVAWRADMDAVPGQEMLDAPYKSRIPGAVHICGHDAHTTIGLGIAKVLASLREEIAGQVKFIFQPAEETVVGARAVINAGGLENPRPGAIFALHCAPLPVGRIGCVPGTVLPGITVFQIVINGDGKTQNLPKLAEMCMNSLRSLSTIGLPSNLQGFVNFMESMETGSETLDTFIIIYCHLKENNGNSLTIEGQVRTANEQLRLETPKMLRSKLDGILGKANVAYDLHWPEHISFPATINPVELEGELRPAIERSIGAANVTLLRRPFPFNSEDFAFYQQEIPGVMYWLGVSNLQRGILGVPHMPGFDIDEESLVVGTKSMANILLAYLDLG